MIFVFGGKEKQVCIVIGVRDIAADLSNSACRHFDGMTAIEGLSDIDHALEVIAD